MTSVEARLFAWHRHYQELQSARGALRQAVLAGVASETIGQLQTRVNTVLDESNVKLQEIETAREASSRSIKV
jgi:hypothetical protein